MPPSQPTTQPTTQIETDLLIIGAGPSGLFATYYAGFRGLRVALVDSLPELGGQVTAMYPEKQIFDVAGFPSIKGRDLVAGLVEQAASAHPEYFLDRTAVSLSHDDDAVTIELDDGTQIRAGAVIITAGIGKFSPRPLPAGDGWVGRGMEFFVPTFAPYAGKDVVIVGGGDSAFDWALHLEPVAKSVTLVHRRDAFRAHQRTVDQVKASSVEIVTRAQVTALLDDGNGGGVVEEVEITVDGAEPVRRPAQAVVAALGFIADLGPLQEWGIEVQKRHIVVDAVDAHQPAPGLRRRRRDGVPRQGAPDRGRFRRGRHRRQQRRRRHRPHRPRLPGALVRRNLSRRWSRKAR